VTAVGQGLDRLDGRRKVTGEATYAAEVPVANVAHAVIVGSTIARGRVMAIDVAAARKAPGVIAVLTHETAPKVPGAVGKQQPNDRVVQALQDDIVQYSDQPIAVVVADTLERAQHAASLVTARYDAAEPVGDIARDLPNAYAPKDLGNRGAAATVRGDVDAGLARAAARVDATYTTPVENHHAMEPHATIAVWQGDDHLTLYDSTQGIFAVRNRIAGIFGLPPENVRVINHFVGGGFGSKGAPWSHVTLAAMAARAVGRAVKLVVTRPQMASLVGHRPKTIQRVELGATADGTLTALRHDVIAETSRFDEFIEPAAVHTRMLYACPNLATAHRAVRIDVPTPTYTRGPGAATGSYALEAAMDELAYALKMDPVALRLRNHADRDAHEDKPFSSKSLRACYQRGGAAFGWGKRRAAPRSMRDGDVLIGWGMATATYHARQQPASARYRLRPDGSVLVQAGTQDIGTGTYTVMTQIAADALGLPVERVSFELGDSTFPETPSSVGSFTAASTGSAVKMAGLAMRQRLISLAVADARSPLHGVAVEDVSLVDGALVSRRDRARKDPLAAIAARSGAEITVEHKTQPSKEREAYSCHSFGAQFAEVRVDEDLGEVRVSRIVGAFAGGRILNAKTAHSQYLGGIVWGIGMALHEHTERDPRTARAVSRDLTDYKIPVHADMPAIDIIMVDEEDRYVNEVGAKGIGEIGTTGVAAAIANAVFHATGRRIRELPITVEKILVG
jgi:xanthine dehydrogenase YagR molybdenum-binding subunit